MSEHERNAALAATYRADLSKEIDAHAVTINTLFVARSLLERAKDRTDGQLLEDITNFLERGQI